ncbi:MAG: NRAMP family divalent metal transporter [Candidatus Micrarchaeia archaeon]
MAKLERFFRIFGPAWLVMLADMDALSIIGAAQVGALFDYGLVWLMLLLIIPLYVVQEVSGRIGAVTRKGLGTVIREHYSKKTAALMSVPMALSDVMTYAAEYIGIAVGLDILGIPIYLGIPLAYVVYLAIVYRKSYKYIQGILVGVSGMLMAGLLITLVLRGVKNYPIVYFSSAHAYLLLIAATIGAVIMPFMLFFQASATAENMSERGSEPLKKVLREMKENTLLGAIVTEILMAVVEMTFSGIGGAAKLSTFASAQQLSKVMAPFAGAYAPYIFGIGLIGAGFLALNVVALGSAWGLAEALKIKRKKLIYVFESLPAAIAAMLMPSAFLINMVIAMLIVFVLVLIGPLIILGLLGRDKKIMHAYALTKREQLVYWLVSLAIVSLAVAAALASL